MQVLPPASIRVVHHFKRVCRRSERVLLRSAAQPARGVESILWKFTADKCFIISENSASLQQFLARFAAGQLTLIVEGNSGRSSGSLQTMITREGGRGSE